MADDSSGITFIDEKGRIFGLVNIIDVLVTVLIIGIVIAGVALILSAGEEDVEPEEELYMTLDMGEQPEYVAEQIQEGDQSHQADSTLTIVDTYMAASGSGEAVDVWVQVKINGTTSGGADALSFGQAPIRFGESMIVDTDQYNETGTVTEISETASDLSVETQELAVVADVAQATADRIAIGDRFTVGDKTWMTVEEVTRYATDEKQTDRLVLGVTTEVRTASDTTKLGDQTVQLGESVPVRFGSDQIMGSIISTDSLEEPGEPSTRTVTMQANIVEQPAADRVEPGMGESVENIEFAGVNSVQTTDGATEISVDMTVQELEDGTVTYRTEPIAPGDEITLRLDTGPHIEWHITEIDG